MVGLRPDGGDPALRLADGLPGDGVRSPPEKTIHVTIAGDYVSESVLEYYEEKAYEEFPEMELITFENIP